MITPIKKWLAAGRRKEVVSAQKLGVEAEQVSVNAVVAIEKLQKHDFTAYIVGGGIRDFLLGVHPKDFDIATDATPEQVRALFGRQSRIIGRRFRIVHLYFNSRKTGREILEVSTFRAEGGDNDKYGNAREDANRRDFTINAIFYDPCKGEVIDYVGGVAAIKKQRLVMIGDPKKRLMEDPVRILRALRLSQKLGLAVDSDIKKWIPKYAPLIADIPYSRLFDELIKVLKSGASARILKQWQHYSIASHIMPILVGDNSFFFSALAENDRRLAENRDTSVSFVVAALFWPSIAEHWHIRRASGERPYGAMEKAMVSAAFSKNRIIPQRLTARIKDLLFLQARMEEPPTKRRAAKICDNPIFDRALAFAAMRQDAGAAQTASWWSQYVRGDKNEQERMLATLPPPPSRRRRSRHRAAAVAAAPPPSAS